MDLLQSGRNGQWKQSFGLPTNLPVSRLLRKASQGFMILHKRGYAQFGLKDQRYCRSSMFHTCSHYYQREYEETVISQVNKRCPADGCFASRGGGQIQTVFYKFFSPNTFVGTDPSHNSI